MIRAQELKHLLGAREGERGGNKGDVRKGAMEKSWRVKVIGGKKVRGDDPIEYFLPTGVRGNFWIPEGLMAVKVPRIKKFLEEGRMEGKKSRFCYPLKSE